MKIAEIRQFTEEELTVELERLQRHLFDLRAQGVTEKLADATQLKKTHKDIARVLTEMRQRDLVAAQSADDSEAK